MSASHSHDRTAVEADQLAKLNRLLATILPANRFYTDKLRKGAAATDRGYNLTSLEDFKRIVPFTAKTEIVVDQAAHPPFGTNLTFPLDRYTRYSQTSGTTGNPLRWLDTNEDWAWMVDNWTRILQAAHVTATDRAYFAFSFGPFIGFWLAFEAAAKLGCLCIPGGGLGSAARLRAIIENEATVLCCTPTYALRLAEIAAEEKIDLGRSRIRTLIVAGEAGGSIPATRARIETAWHGARVFDHHGMTEVGPVTYEWPDRPGFLAVIEAGYLAEIVDPKTDREVGDGEIGELILTPLGRVGSPVLRYRTGDLVKKAFIDNHLVLEGGILGRADDMVIIRGVNIHPSAVEDIIRAFPEIVEYRVEIHERQTMPEMHVAIEPPPSVSDKAAVSRRLEAEFRARFSLRVSVTIVAPGSLPRFELKATRWVRL